MTEREKLKERLWIYRYTAFVGFAAVIVGGLVGPWTNSSISLAAMLTGAITWALFGCAAISIERRLTNRGSGE